MSATKTKPKTETPAQKKARLAKARKRAGKRSTKALDRLAGAPRPPARPAPACGVDYDDFRGSLSWDEAAAAAAIRHDQNIEQRNDYSQPPRRRAILGMMHQAKIEDWNEHQRLCDLEAEELGELGDLDAYWEQRARDLDEYEASQENPKMRAPGYVFPRRKAWPIGDKRHALLAIDYMRAGRGKRADYPKVKAAILRRWQKVSPEVDNALAHLASERSQRAQANPCQCEARPNGCASPNPTQLGLFDAPTRPTKRAKAKPAKAAKKPRPAKPAEPDKRPGMVTARWTWPPSPDGRRYLSQRDHEVRLRVKEWIGPFAIVRGVAPAKPKYITGGYSIVTPAGELGFWSERIDYSGPGGMGGFSQSSLTSTAPTLAKVRAVAARGLKSAPPPTEPDRMKTLARMQPPTGQETGSRAAQDDHDKARRMLDAFPGKVPAGKRIKEYTTNTGNRFAAYEIGDRRYDVKMRQGYMGLPLLAPAQAKRIARARWAHEQASQENPRRRSSKRNPSSPARPGRPKTNKRPASTPTAKVATKTGKRAVAGRVYEIPGRPRLAVYREQTPKGPGSRWVIGHRPSGMKFAATFATKAAAIAAAGRVPASNPYNGTWTSWTKVPAADKRKIMQAAKVIRG